MINLGEALQIVLAVSLLRWCEATLACNTLASALLCSLSPSYFQHLPRTASESCSGAGVYSCSLKRLPLLTPLNKTHSSATLNFRPCFYCFSKHCDACNLTTKRSILQPTPCCSQCDWVTCTQLSLSGVCAHQIGRRRGTEYLSEKEYFF